MIPKGSAYITLVNHYYDLCNELAMLDKKKYSFMEPEKTDKDKFSIKKLFSSEIVDKNDSFELHPVEEIETVKKLAQKCILNIDTMVDNPHFPEELITFILFIKEMERSFFLENDDNHRLYVTKSDKLGQYNLYIELPTISITYEIERSAINIPDHFEDDNPLSFMNDNHEEKSTNKVIFCNIKVRRNYGENMTDSINIVSGSTIGEDRENDMMYRNIFRITDTVIKETLFDILNNSVRPMTNLEDNIRIEDIINDKLHIWRLGSN